MTSVILTTPYLAIIAVLVITLILFEKYQRATGFVLPILSMALSVFVIIDALLLGATFSEVLIFAVIVFALFAFSLFEKKDGEDE